MSTTTYTSNINRINLSIADLLKKQNSERKKATELSSKILGLRGKLASSKNPSSAKSIQRQIDGKEKELNRVNDKIADYHKKVTIKNKELQRNENSLKKEIEKELKKNQTTELDFLKEKEHLNRSEINNIRTINYEREKRQSHFQRAVIKERA